MEAFLAQLGYLIETKEWNERQENMNLKYKLNKEGKLIPKKNSDKTRLDFLETRPTILSDFFGISVGSGEKCNSFRDAVDSAIAWDDFERTQQ
jgi:hypothetical protein